MTDKKEINAGILIIGNEVLSGRTKDVNTSTLATWLSSLGIKVNEVRVIPDIEKTIIDTVNELRKKYTYIFTTGGIGPTHDDITAESISKAFGIEYNFHKEAFKILESYYKPGEFNEGRQKMAKMPVTSNLILNPTSGAPGFYVEILSSTINLRTVESEIAKSLTEVQNNNIDVDIGSYPFFKAGKLGVSIVLRSTDQNKIDKCNSEILKFVSEKKIEIVERD